ncbi:MAG TPA: DUF2786 domain-containing protein [Candidatus Dojkabacteria bacterium]|nr:DUF2786 domain-containing protein [Candidatus Dojkabacteria bacterium]
MEANENIIAKINKLFALAKSSNENEAAVAMAKAHELLTSYNLEMEDVILKDKDKEEKVVEDDYGMAMYRNWEKLLFASIASLNFCRLIANKGRKDRRTVLTIIGKPTNILATKVFIEYISSVIDRLTKENYGLGKQYLESYKIGLSTRLRYRIAEKAQEDLSSDCKALVVTEDANNQSFLDKAYPKITDSKIKIESKDSEAYYKGWVDGGDVSLVNQIEE